MPKIFDNIENYLSKGLSGTLTLSKRGDFCVGYFNLRGWHEVADQVDALSGLPVIENGQHFHRYCRLLVGMQKLPSELLRDSFYRDDSYLIDQSRSIMTKKRFKLQILSI